MALCVKVEKAHAEETRQKLLAQKLLETKYAPFRDRDFVYFPVKKAPAGMAVVELSLEERQTLAGSLRLALKDKLEEKEIGMLVGSFDIVGDIAVVEIPHELEKKEGIIASEIMRKHRNIRVVAKKLGATSGEFRIRPVKVIAGEPRTHTVHKEGGCFFELDLNKVYFSPRLGTERGRIANLVKPGEKILVPFAGVGPFAIRIAKKQKDAEVIGIELNPEAVEYFERNIKRNSVRNISAICGDAKKILPGRFASWADRVIMPLPKGSGGFLLHAIPCLAKGGILHYYAFGESAEPFWNAEKEIEEAAKELGRKTEILFKRVVRPYSKEIVQVVIDAKIS
ncbi:MAG: class I SAM-dependent methyltransferase family protein [Candidatus Anstonellaceae archaeon]